MRDIVLLNDLKFDGVINLPIFKIEKLISTIDLSSYDALIFTSKNAIYSIDSISNEWKNIPSYCIAPKTAEAVLNKEGNVVFVGEKSHGNEFAQELIPLLLNKKVLYIKAEKTVSKLFEILKNNQVDIEEKAVYKTVCNKNSPIDIRPSSILIFTSPSSVECFFKQYSWKSSYKAIVIGKTTAKYMPDNIEFIISSEQSVDSCVKLASTLK